MARALTEAPTQPETHALTTPPPMNPPESAEPGEMPTSGKRGRPKGSRDKKGGAKVDVLGDERMVRLAFHIGALIGGRTPDDAETAYQRFISV